MSDGSLPAKLRRAALEALSRDRLAEITSLYDLSVADRRAHSAHVDAILHSRSVNFADVLRGLSRNELKAICSALGLDTSGKEKEPIVERILARGDQKELPLRAPVTADTEVRSAPAKPARKNGGDLGFEDKLWKAADELRGSMDAAEYKHVVLGLIFLKYVSDAFVERHRELEAEVADGADPEDADEYRAHNVFWVPREARWERLQSQAKQPNIGKLVDDAMVAIERDNQTLKGVLPKDYARPALDKQRLGALIDLISTIGLGDEESRKKDILGRVYEYFLAQFASAEGKKGGQFYTPRCVVRTLVEMLAPYKGRVFDPCCGSGGMFIQSEKFVEAHGGRVGDISIFGQESNTTTWRLAKMNLAIRGIDAGLGEPDPAGSFFKDQHPDLKADFILANPPFNDSSWGGERLREDVRWKYGVPPVGNANFAWVQHFIHHLSPTGTAAFLLANGSMSSNQSGEGDIRKALIEADLVDCMVAMPSQLFYSTQIPVCVWVLARDKRNHRHRDRRGETLFIDARNLGTMVSRVQRELKDEDIARIAGVYHAWRGDKDAQRYEDVAGFCKAARAAEVAANGFVLTPGRYVGAEAVEDNDEPFEARFPKLVAKLEEQFAASRTLETAIRKNLVRMTHGE
jgi:type I restriction enzyme M protein